MLLKTEKCYMKTSELFQFSVWQNFVLLLLSVHYIANFVLLSSIKFLLFYIRWFSVSSFIFYSVSSLNFFV